MSPTLRQPTDRAELYAWHAKRLAWLEANRMPDYTSASRVAHDWERDEMPNVYENEPQCGYFKAKVSRRALLVPAKIWLHSVIGEDGQLVEPEVLKCEIGDRPFDVLEVWPRLAMRPITAGEYRHLMALRQWAKESAPDQPQAVDGRPIDWNTVQIVLHDPPAPQPKRNR